MPWTSKDAESHTKAADTAEKRRVWAEVANERLAACLKQHEGEVDDAQRKQCEGSAIRQANSAVGRIKESNMAFGDVGQIAKSAIETGLAIINETGELAPDRAKTLLHALESDLEGVWQPGIGLLPTAPGQVKIDGRLVSIRELAEAYAEAGKLSAEADYQHKDDELAQKAEQAEGVDGSLDDRLDTIKSAFRATFRKQGESETSETDLWARDVLENNEHFGNSVVCRAEDGLHYAVSYNQAADGSYGFAPRQQWKRAVLTYVPPAQEVPAQECQFTESMPLAFVGDLTEAAGPLLASLSETITPGTGTRSPVIVDFELIRPGPGNKRDRHYYSPAVLKRDASVFKGVDIFVTDHKEKERSERTKVGRVREIAGFTNGGAPIGRAVIYDPDQAEKTRNRADAGELSTLECSIFASGLAKPGNIGGEDYQVVEAITSATALELVSKAGAGGHAKNLVESEAGGDEMGEEQEVPKDGEETEPKPTEEQPKEEPTKETPEQPAEVPAEEVEKALAEAKLPEGLRKWVAKGTYKTGDELKAAIAEAQADAKKLTGSGAVFGMGLSQPVIPETKELDEALAEVDAQYHVKPLFGGA